MNRRLILGIDPGFDRCGWAVIAAQGRQYKAIDFGCVMTDRKASKDQRFLQIWQQLTKLFVEYPLTEIAMESLYFSRNVSTALPVSEVRGLLYAQAFTHQVPVIEYTPSAIKLAITGYGKADKSQMLSMVTQLLKLEKIPNIDDTGDALAVALTHVVSHQPGL